jgi:hypothetical protein
MLLNLPHATYSHHYFAQLIFPFSPTPRYEEHLAPMKEDRTPGPKKSGWCSSLDL